MEGSVCFDEARSRWIGRLDLGRAADGHRVRLKVTARTRTEARAKLDDLRRQKEAAQDLTVRTMTFEVLATTWLERGLPSAVSEPTRDNYRSMVATHLLPRIGGTRVSTLRPDDIEDVLDSMVAAGYPGRTMTLVLNLARRIFKYGVARSVLPRNVADPVTAPRGPRKERFGLTEEQARALLEAASGHRLGPLITVSLLLGLRPGDAAALTWACLDLNGPTPRLRVEASLRRTGKRHDPRRPQDPDQPADPRPPPPRGRRPAAAT